MCKRILILYVVFAFLCSGVSSASSSITIYSNNIESDSYATGSFRAETEGEYTVIALYSGDTLIKAVEKKAYIDGGSLAEMNINGEEGTHIRIFNLDRNANPLSKYKEVQYVLDKHKIFCNGSFEEDVPFEISSQASIEKEDGNSYLKLSCDGTNSAIQNIYVKNPAQRIVFEADYKMGNPSFDARIICLNYGSFPAIVKSENGQLYCREQPVGALSDSEWTNVAVCFDFDTASYEVYINRQSVYSANLSSPSVKKHSYSRLLQIRSLEEASEGSLMIDNIKIYDGTDFAGFVSEKASVTYLDTEHVLNEMYKDIFAYNSVSNKALLNGKKISAHMNGKLVYCTDGTVIDLEAENKSLNTTDFGLITLCPKDIVIADSELWRINNYLLYENPDLSVIKRKIETAGHPRLILTKQRMDLIKNSTDEGIEAARDNTLSYAVQLLETPVINYSISENDSMRHLEYAMERILTLGLAFQLSKNDDYANRAYAELEAINNVRDWNSSKFLDVAECTAIFSLAYDWMYDGFTKNQRTRISDLILNNGVTKSYKSYFGYGFEDETKSDWVDDLGNWNIICNTGSLLGALAVFEASPEVCAKTAQCAILNLQNTLNYFYPQGGWSEGAGYWSYSMRFLTLALSSMEGALNTHYGILATAGLEDTAMFGLSLEGAKEQMNLCDAGADHTDSAEMYYWAEKYNMLSVGAAREYMMTRYGFLPDVYDLMYRNPDYISPNGYTMENAYYVKGVETLSLHGGEDAASAYIGYSGGLGKTPHGHLDSGGFVADLGGERFALDIGADSYSASGYFGTNRYLYYRTRPEGHNVFVINPQNQTDTDGAAYYGQSLTAFSEITDHGQNYGVMNLSRAYARDASSAQRRIDLVDNSAVQIEDSISLLSSSEVHWYMHTDADITKVNDNTFELKKGEATARLTITTNCGGSGEIAAAARLIATEAVTDSDNSEIKKIRFVIENASGEININAKLELIGDGTHE